MQLHRQPIFHTHSSHLSQHLRLKQLNIPALRLAAVDALIQRRGLTERQVRSLRRQVPMIRSLRSVLLEERPSVAKCIQVALVVRNVLVRHLAELRQVLAEATVLRVHHRIRPERRNHAAFPSALADLLVLCERVDGSVRCCQYLDPEAVEERTGTELRRAQGLIDGLVELISVLCAQSLLQTEELLESVVEPQSRRSSAEEEIVLCEDPPDLARIGLLPSVRLRNSERLHADSLRIQHAEDVVIRLDEERRRIRKRLVVCKPLRIRMSMRADDRQVRYRRI